MTLTEIVTKLKEILDKHGDMEVITNVYIKCMAEPIDLDITEVILETCGTKKQVVIGNGLW